MFDRTLRRQVRRLHRRADGPQTRSAIAPRAVWGAIALALAIALAVEPRIALNRLYELPPTDALDAYVIFPLEARVEAYEAWRDRQVESVLGGPDDGF